MRVENGHVLTTTTAVVGLAGHDTVTCPTWPANVDAEKEGSPHRFSLKAPSVEMSLYVQASWHIWISGEEATVAFENLSQVNIPGTEKVVAEVIVRQGVVAAGGIRVHVSNAVENACGTPPAGAPGTQHVDEAAMLSDPDGGPMICVFVAESRMPVAVNVRHHVSHA